MPDQLRAALLKQLRAHLRPVLAAQGFRGGPTRYYRESEEVWELVELQSTRRFPVGLGDPRTLSFTANLGVASKWILAQKRGFPQRPPERIAHHYENRVGSFMRPPYDRWWSITESATESEQAAEVRDFAEAIVDVGLPGIARFASDELLMDSIVANGPDLRPNEVAWLALLARKPHSGPSAS